MDVSENSGTPKSSILIGFFIINHPFWGTFIFGNTHIKQQGFNGKYPIVFFGGSHLTGVQEKSGSQASGCPEGIHLKMVVVSLVRKSLREYRPTGGNPLIIEGIYNF